MLKDRKKLTFRTAIAVVVVLLTSFFLAPQVSAITLIPPSMELGLTPGQPLNTVIKLFNETTDTIELYVEARNFSAKGETGQPTFDFNAEQIGFSTWIELEEDLIILEPGERYEVPITINPPQDADPGGHYAAVFFSTAPPESGQVRVASKIGTLILASVEGEIAQAGNISEFIIKSGESVFNRLPVEFLARFQNTGNVHLKPTGNVVITNLFGNTSDTLDFNAGMGATLPKTTRKYETKWEKGVVNGEQGNFWSNFWREYGNERENFALGKYTAQLNITAGTNEAVKDSATVSFWVIPWRVLLVWAVVIVLVLLVIILGIKKYNKWIIKKSQK